MKYDVNDLNNNLNSDSMGDSALGSRVNFVYDSRHDSSDTTYLKSDFLKEVVARGFLYQCSNLTELDDLLSKNNPKNDPKKGSDNILNNNSNRSQNTSEDYLAKTNPSTANPFINNNSITNSTIQSITGYTGYDMTAASLHVGNLVSIMLLKWFEKFGYSPVVLLGGGTTRIGDPSDKNEARPVLNDDTIDSNMNSIRKVFGKILDNPIIVNNRDWLDELGYIDLIREVGTCFSVNKMVNLEIFRRRLNENMNLSFLEFNYLILQSYDFLKLYRSHKCVIQFGGSDQWANILNGTELIRRKENGSAFAFTVPLITNSNGKKMGKSVNGAVWLNEEMTSAYDYWQFWRNTADEDVGRFLRLYTFLPLSEIEHMEQAQGEDINAAKVVLANAATEILYGKGALQNIQNNFSTSVSVDLSDSIINAIKNSGIANSNSEAKQLIRGGAVRLNDELVTSEKILFEKKHFLNDVNVCEDISDMAVLKIGKNKKIAVHLKK